ncbi:MAG: molybdate ABC transporter permease subunit [Pseudomonadota bacterium]|jgi:molybdate transport system permease protein
MLDIFQTLAILSPDLWQSLWLTLRLATVTALLLVAIGVPLAWWLNTSRFRGISLIETLVSLPIVLPPTVIGFYLLILLSPQQPVGRFWLETFGYSLTFSFAGLVIGSVFYSLPFAVQPFQAAFRGVPPTLIEASAALGATAMQRFWRIVVPAARRGIGVGATLSFAHTIGEFGVVLMLGGNIPGETRVASIALYDEAQQLNYAHAHAYALALLAISFLLIFAMTWLQRQERH